MKLITGISLIITVLWLLNNSDLTFSKRLLMILPIPSYSHQIVFRALCRALLKRGHELVVVTPNALNDSTLVNYTEIDISFTYQYVNYSEISQMAWGCQEIIWNKLWLLGHTVANDVFRHPDFMKYYANDSDAKFDMIIAEMTATPATYILAHRFNAPLVGIMSMSLQNYYRFNLRSSVLPSHSSNFELEDSIELKESFWKRLINFFKTWQKIYIWSTVFINKQQEIAERYFGKDIPHILDIAKNMSLILINQEALLSYSRPEIPNVIHFSGLHIIKNPPAPSQDLQKFMDGATNGFIYMSLGTNVRSNFLPKETLKIFTDTFANLPYRVLWKFEDDNFQTPANVLISKWIQQQSVLAHSNIKLFIYQGGLQSTEEAVYNGVPLIGIPFVFDQVYQVMKMVSLGVAKHLNVLELTVPKLHNTIMEVTGDKRYKDRIIELQALIKDKPQDSLENVIWWIEFVLRHNGAPHLRYSGADNAWYQYFDIDIIVCLTIGSLLVLCGFLYVIRWVTTRLLCQQYNRVLSTSEKKKEA